MVAPLTYLGLAVLGKGGRLFSHLRSSRGIGIAKIRRKPQSRQQGRHPVHVG
jgi:hypothetical protein